MTAGELPASVAHVLTKVEDVGEQFELAEQLGYEPQPEEVVRALKLSEKKAAMVARALEINALRHNSLDDSNETGEWRKTLPDNRCQDPLGQLAEAEAFAWVTDCLSRLDERQATVLRMRYGLWDEPPLTLREIGERLGLTRERVRQLERLALETLTSACTGSVRAKEMRKGSVVE